MDKKNDLKDIIYEFKEINFIKKKTATGKRVISPDEWIKLNDIFNRFVNHKMKPFKKIKDEFMIL